MYKHMPSNYSLWPQPARPRRRKRLTLVGTGFAIGVGCAITAYCVMAAFSILYDSVGPATVPEPAAERVENVLTVAPAVESAATPGPELVEPVSRPARARAAKVTLPIIGSKSALPSAGTDGRGGEGLADGASVATWRSGGSDNVSVEGERVLQPLAEEASVEQTKPATASERPITPRKKYTARRQKRERPTNYAARYRQRPLAVSLVSPTSIWY